MFEYRVESVKDLAIIMDYFDKYPVITQKQADYLLFNMAINLMKEKAYLNSKGLRKLIAIRASLNWGLPSALEAAFPNIIPVLRPNVLNCKIKDPNWLAGFTSAEGSFMIKILNSSSNRLGFQVLLKFAVIQHSRDEELLKSLVSYLGVWSIPKKEL